MPKIGERFRNVPNQRDGTEGMLSVCGALGKNHMGCLAEIIVLWELFDQYEYNIVERLDDLDYGQLLLDYEE